MDPVQHCRYCFLSFRPMTLPVHLVTSSLQGGLFCPPCVYSTPTPHHSPHTAFSHVSNNLKSQGVCFGYLIPSCCECVSTSFSVFLKHCLPVSWFSSRLCGCCCLFFVSSFLFIPLMCWFLGYFSRFLFFFLNLSNPLAEMSFIFVASLSSGSDDSQITSPDFPSGLLTQTSLASGWFQ